MRKHELKIYERPELTTTMVEVELGFAFSTDWDDNVDPYEPVTPPGGEDLIPDDDW